MGTTAVFLRTGPRRVRQVAPSRGDSTDNLTPAVPGPPVAQPGDRQLLVSLASGQAVLALVLVGAATVMPAVAADLNGAALYGAAFSAMGLAMVALIVLSGHLVALLRPDRLLATGLAIVAIGSLAIAVTPVMEGVVLGRVVQGIGLGVVMVLVWSVVGAGLPAGRRAHGVLVMSVAWAIAALVGPAVAGVAVDLLSWRATFAALAPVAVVAMVLARRALAPLAGHLHAARSAPILEVAALTAGLAAVVAGLSRAGPSPLAASFVLVGVPGVYWALVKVFPPGTMRLARGAPAAVGVIVLAGFAMFGTEAFLPLALADLHHASATVTGLAVATSPLMWAVGSATHARVAIRWMPGRTLAAGAGMLAVGLAGMQLVLLRTMPVAVVFPVWGIAGLGMGMTYNVASVAAFEATPNARHAAIAASLQLAEAVTLSLGAAVSGALVAWLGHNGASVEGPLHLAWALAGCTALGAATVGHRLTSDGTPGSRTQRRA